MANGKSDIALSLNYGDKNSPKGVVLATKAVYTVPAAGGPGIGELVEMVPVPKGAKILGMTVSASNGTATMTISVGDAGAAGRFLAAKADTAAMIAQLELGLGYAYPANDTIDITFNTAAPTATGVYTMVVFYMM